MLETPISASNVNQTSNEALRSLLARCWHSSGRTSSTLATGKMGSPVAQSMMSALGLGIYGLIT
jgi:hypothetical protein